MRKKDLLLLIVIVSLTISSITASSNIYAEHLQIGDTYNWKIELTKGYKLKCNRQYVIVNNVKIRAKIVDKQANSSDIQVKVSIHGRGELDTFWVDSYSTYFITEMAYLFSYLILPENRSNELSYLSYLENYGFTITYTEEYVQIGPMNNYFRYDNNGVLLSHYFIYGENKILIERTYPMGVDIAIWSAMGIGIIGIVIALFWIGRKKLVNRKSNFNLKQFKTLKNK